MTLFIGPTKSLHDQGRRLDQKDFMTILLPILLAATCQNYSAQCACYPAVPFEGYQVYVTEICDKAEGSIRYGEQVYDSKEQCDAWIAQDPNCQSL